MIIVGIDIGTTNIGLVAIDPENGRIVERFSTPNVRVHSNHNYAYLQDPQEIGNTVENFLKRLSVKPVSIGITGQVHGILYTDIMGTPLSNLYTWLDQRGVEIIDGQTSQNELLKKCGGTLPSGYGLLTHYTNRKLGVVPKGTVQIQGICEYVTGRLLKRTLKKTDQSCLSAFGAWDTVNEVHNSKLLTEILPQGSPAFLSASEPFEQAGKTDEGIPVAYPIGDNQAGFFGIVTNWNTECLVSIGTSGQLTLFTPQAHPKPELELRPYLGYGYLQVGATLCAGKSYETLEKFVLSVLQNAGLHDIDDDFVYAMLKTAAESGDNNPLTITTTLKGTRSDANLRGSITGIGLDNCNLGNLVRGTITGIVNELFQFRANLDFEFRSIKKIIITGNAVKKNPLLAQYLKRQFDMDVVIADADASIGVAIIGAISAGIIQANDRIPLLNKIIRNNDSKRER